MSQGSKGGLWVFEDFTWTAADTAIADATAEIQPGQGVTISGTGSALTLASTEDEPGGILSIDVTDDAADDGFSIFSTPFRPADGAAVIEVRVKTNDISGTNFFVGFQETLTQGDAVMPYTMATTVITVVDTGVTAGVFVDHNATNEDWHFAAAQDAAAAAGVDLTDPGINNGNGVGLTGGGRAGADLSTATGDDEWIIFRVEIEEDGLARGMVGSSHNDPSGTGPRMIGETDRGALDATAMVFPVVMIENNVGTGITAEIDYYFAQSARDWSV